MPEQASNLARRLADQAEAVCRHYLSNGRREGRYWLVGDTQNTPGRSLYVRLHDGGTNGGTAGKWTDAATGEHGDLLDLIAANRQLGTLRETLDEARDFLSLPRPDPPPRQLPAPTGSPEAARRLFAMAQPIAGTLAETYLQSRGLSGLRPYQALRFHPRCYYRGDEDDPRDQARDTWPALIAAVTDLSGVQTGAHRTWLDPSGRDKAPVSTQRRAMGQLLGHGVRFGVAQDVMAAGEGIETMLSLRCVMPTLPMVAALSANHLAALSLPPTLRRIYLARDGDAAGHTGVEALADRARSTGIKAVVLDASLGDFNDDLRAMGPAALATVLQVQLASEDVTRFLDVGGLSEAVHACYYDCWSDFRSVTARTG
ncbi:DNA primase [Sphingomonas koreensis]|uniref:DUF7146 domain-containing protein n=1 Tax=Sphingomonas TaxID=13687 RepID=UPI000A01F80B|nr:MULTISPECIES: toprim domain-containing protein [Sphingomonas]PJI89279.1 phage/plasmid primase-like uncharacterized protein [Sphingomonas koreensis]RSU59775.1 DNA primase [Sphingomonas koreensis]RSU70831.1 DNA primase [Sphingomonas koreensis]RSV13301.1 DNA primase [Sphingomonas sp. ABOLF]